MNRRQFLYAGASAGLAACWVVPSAADAPAEKPKAELDYQDVVYFAGSRPVLLRLHIGVDGRPLSVAWNDYVTKVFKYLDTNGDGFLDRDEVQRMPSPNALFGANYGAVPTLSDLDANGDGKVTRDELAAYFRRIGATPFQVPAGGRNGNDSTYYDLAILIDGEVQPFQYNLGGGGNNMDAVNDALFKLLDTNGDGKLSKEELLAAPKVLLKRDRNDDEMITPEEIVPGFRGRGNIYNVNVIDLDVQELAFYSLNSIGNNRGGNGPFWLASPGASKADLARQLQQHYGKSGDKGQPAPTKLGRKDLGLDEATFAKLDVDGDGLLDTEELARFAQRTPDLELNVDLGRKAAVALVKRGTAMEANVRVGKDGAVILEMDGTRLDFKGLAAEKVETAKAAQQEREQYLQAFKAADLDKNGYLDMSEAMRSPLYRNLFKVMDRDGDGKLFEKEVLAYLDAYQELQAAARLSCATVGITSEGKGLFEMLDTDGDGRLSVREMRNAVKLLAELDRDGDGMISRAEIPRCSQATFRMGPASNGFTSHQGYAVILNDFSGSISGGAPQPNKPPRGPEWFRKMDRNGDGDVSRREFLGTDAQFREIDTDGDGLISVEEAEAYDKKMRQGASRNNSEDGPYAGDQRMNRREFLHAGAAAGLATGCAIPSAADAPPQETPKRESDYQDVVYFAGSRPVLLRLHLGVDGRPLSAAWNDYVTKVFQYLDTNGDGFLDRDEVQRVPSPEVLFGGNYGYGGAPPTLSDLDTNADGKVTRDQLAAYFRRVGATPFQVPGGGRRAEDEYFYAVQLRLELEIEGVRARLGGRGPASMDEVNDALFKLLDTNGDGKLSKEELLAAPTVLLKHDRNDDEMITPDEIVPGARANRGSGDVTEELLLAELYLAQYQRGSRGNNGPFWLASPGASKADLARRLQQHYGKGGDKGQPAPTKLARKDLGLDEATFAKLDVDGDGLLDTEELARFAQRPPDLELNVDLGRKAAVALVKRGTALEANVRTGKDGTVILEMDGVRLDLKGLASPKVEIAQVAQQEREQYLQAFKAADLDKNGYLDMSEAMRSPLYRNLFKVMDRDGDGKLFEKEVLAYLDAYQELQSAARLSCATVGITSEGKGLFEMLDTDGDGRLSVREMRNAVKLLAELDRDGDGMISRAEIPRVSQATFRMGPAGAEQFVSTRTGRIRGRTNQPAKPARGPEWFRKMDRNGDGDVSRREFLGTDAQFREIDTDGDGLISVEEAEAYDKKRREQK